MNTTIYTVGGKTFELRHYGVKGMKWGRRKARPQATGTGRRGGQTDSSPEAQAARKQKLKRAAKIGAAVVATALAAYGAKKIRDIVRDYDYYADEAAYEAYENAMRQFGSEKMVRVKTAYEAYENAMRQSGPAKGVRVKTTLEAYKKVLRQSGYASW